MFLKYLCDEQVLVEEIITSQAGLKTKMALEKSLKMCAPLEKTGLIRKDWNGDRGLQSQ